MRWTYAVFAAAIVVRPVFASAEICPEDKIVAGEPESSLAGFEIRDDTIDDLRRELGRPSKLVRRVGDGYPRTIHHTYYKWGRDDYRIGAGVDPKGEIGVLHLSAQTPQPDVPGTGRGLRLGDSFERVRELYGATLIEGSYGMPEIGARNVTFCFSDMSQLGVGLDAEDKVIALRLLLAPPL